MSLRIIHRVSDVVHYHAHWMAVDMSTGRSAGCAEGSGTLAAMTCFMKVFTSIFIDNIFSAYSVYLAVVGNGACDDDVPSGVGGEVGQVAGDCVDSVCCGVVRVGIYSGCYSGVWGFKCIVCVCWGLDGEAPLVGLRLWHLCQLCQLLQEVVRFGIDTADFVRLRASIWRCPCG